MSEDLKRKVAWLDKREYIEQFSFFGRWLYYLGVIKQKRYTNLQGKPRQVYSGRCYRSMFGFRWWHPLSIILVFLMFYASLLEHLFKAFIEALKVTYMLNKQEVSVDKKLKFKD